MAGRGTDIILGGNWKAQVAKLDNPTPEQIEAIKAEWEKNHEIVMQAGGLHIIGTERHESRRIDNQLRGRSGRQGDPGSSRFYLSLEDGLMRIYLNEGKLNMMRKALSLIHILREIYKGAKFKRVKVQRSISQSSEKRVKVKELIAIFKG